MTGTVIEFVEKTENGYKNVNGVRVVCKGNSVLDYLNKYYGEVGSKEPTDAFSAFYGCPVTWEFDEKENTYFSKREDGTITGEAFKVIGTKEW